MQIDTDLLYTWGAVTKKIARNNFVFYEDDMALAFYQVLEGTVKMTYTNTDGKELTVGVFEEGHSFGEPPLFIDRTYPASAIAQTDCVIIKLAKDKFFEMLKDHPAIQSDILKLFASRVYNKIVFSKNIINQKPEYRITYFLDNYKKQKGIAPGEKLLISYTRQQIADFTGLRVETVIRTLSAMNKQKRLQITDHKLYY